MSIVMLSEFGGYHVLAIPSVLQSRFEEHLRNKTIPDHLQWQYKKWLRYYLDYCVKYHCSPSRFVCCCEFHFFPETKDFFPYIIGFSNFRYGANYAGAPSGDIGNVIFLNASDCDKRDRTIADCVIQIFEADGLANVFFGESPEDRSDAYIIRPHSHGLPGLTWRVGGKTNDHVSSGQFPDFMKWQIILSYVHAVGLH